MIAAGMAAGSLYTQSSMKVQLPPINDVQTDWSRPVAFTETTLRERAKVGAIRVRDDALVPEGNGEWSGMSFAEAQAEVYIDLEPLMVKQPVAEAPRRLRRRPSGWAGR